MSAIVSNDTAKEMSVLVECTAFKIVDKRDVLVEERNGGKNKRLRLVGVIQKCDEVNTNRRIYPLSVVKPAIDKIQPLIKDRRVLGELDHPDAAVPKVHLGRVSHLVTKVWLDGKNVMGEIEVLDKMPCGGMLKALIESNIPISVSSRGVGSCGVVTISDGIAYEVLPNFKFITWDIVADPAVVEAQLSVMESKNYLTHVKKIDVADFARRFGECLRGMK